MLKLNQVPANEWFSIAWFWTTNPQSLASSHQTLIRKIVALKLVVYVCKASVQIDPPTMATSPDQSFKLWVLAIYISLFLEWMRFGK